ncbi:hypothetical protein HDF16_003244 [Granulicella aggregans]|uniref:Uncharacterized protein n=1 Tax=Granulicella aggregans TaxID=474949 RepID=A0A7W7ZEM7_9BACT|nr:hypothetical protein [Granulicella aggregans]MBB5058530.1 hypothetical protein [Granulicella aggregans]
MPATHTITGPTSLQRSLWLRRGTHIVLALPSFSVVQQENLQARFNRQLSESGNEFCTVALIASLVGYILFDAAHWAFFTVHPVTMLTANLLVCLAAALFGKALGVLRARWQLARLIWFVAERLEDLEENSSPLAFPSAPRGDLFAMHSRSASSLGRVSTY